MYLNIPANGYHTPSPVAYPGCVMCALVESYRKRAKRKISIKEYRKVL